MTISTYLDIRASAGDVQLGKKPNTVRKTYTVEASSEVIARFDRFLRHLQWCAGVGHSTTVAMEIDGDGADRFSVIAPAIGRQKGEGITKKGSYEVGQG